MGLPLNAPPFVNRPYDARAVPRTHAAPPALRTRATAATAAAVAITSPGAHQGAAAKVAAIFRRDVVRLLLQSAAWAATETAPALEAAAPGAACTKAQQHAADQHRNGWGDGRAGHTVGRCALSSFVGGAKRSERGHVRSDAKIRGAIARGFAETSAIVEGHGSPARQSSLSRYAVAVVPQADRLAVWPS